MKVYFQMTGEHQRALGYSNPCLVLPVIIEPDLEKLNSLDRETIDLTLKAFAQDILFPEEFLNFENYNIYEYKGNLFIRPWKT